MIRKHSLKRRKGEQASPVPGPICLLTDFGNRDGYAGVLKGVIAGINPAVQVLELSHEILPQDLQAANFVLFAHYAYYPPGTIFVVVVDPTVGTKRRAILVETKRYYFIAPDNGCLSYALSQEKIAAVYQIKNRRYALPQISTSFHGRDIFSPASAHLSLGISPAAFGPKLPLGTITRWSFPKIARTKQGVKGEVLYVDRFGSLLSNIHRRDLAPVVRGKHRVMLQGQGGVQDLGKLAKTYGHRKVGDLLAFISSSGLLEVAQNMGSAADVLGGKVGDAIFVERSKT